MMKNPFSALGGAKPFSALGGAFGAGRFSAFFIAVLAVCLAAPRTLRSQLVGGGTPAQVSGPMTIAWADPVEFRGKPQIRAFVYDEATRRNYEVRIDSALAASRGGLLAMNGKRVSLNTGSSGIVTRIASVEVSTSPTGVPANLTNPILNAKTLSGTRKYVILGCKYSDTPANPWPITEALALWNTNPVSVKGYWLEVSDNRLTVTADASDWKGLPYPKSHYVLSSGAAELGLITDDCIAAHDGTVNFSLYDGIAFQMSADLGCCAVAGGLIKTLDGQQKFFSMVWIPGNLAHAAGVTGTYTHEIGHNFGLLHTVPADENTYAAKWNVMSDGFAATEGDARFGAQIIAAQKEQLGWIPPSRRFVATAPVSTVTLERNALPADNTNYQVIVVPIGATERFYAVELRKAVANSYDRAIPLEGVVIHDWYMPEVIPWASKVVDADGNGDSNDAGAVWTPGETFLDARNRISITVESIGATSAQVTIRNGAGVAFQASAMSLKRTMVAGSAPVLDSVRIGLDGSPGGSFSWTADRYPGSVTGLGRSSWLQLLNATGSGSGQLRMRHDPSGMGVGVYVDSVRVSSLDFIRRLQIVDTLEITAPATLFAGLSVRSRSDSNLTPFSPVDSAYFNITGPGASTAAWTATRRRPSTQFLPSSEATVSGTGPGMLRWMRNATAPGFASGMYVDTITVSITGTAITAAVIDTFISLPPNQFTKPLTRGKRYTQLQGAVPVLDSAEVGLSGPHAVSGEWKVISDGGETQSNWFMEPVRNFNRDVLGSSTWRGVGNGWFRYTRGNRVLGPGTYIDTLTILGPFAFWEGNSYVPTHQGKQYVIDTLEVLATPRSITFVPAFRYDTLVAGMSSPTDSVRPVFLGPGSAHQDWVATARGTLDVPDYMGSTTRGANVAPNALSWARNLAGLLPGIHVDTIDVTTITGASPITAYFVDTVLIVTTAMQVPKVRVISVRAGAAPAVDSLDVALLGPGGASVAWTATNKQTWNAFTAATGTGTGKVRWTRSVGSLAVGTYVDTITVLADGGSLAPQRFIDTVRVRPATVLASSVASRTASRGQGQAAVPDSATITITGDIASFVTWTATKRKTWTTLTTANGTGSGKVRWTKDPGSLTAGTYVDTLTIAATEGVNGATIVDTLIVVAPTVLAASTASKNVTTVAGHAPVADSADVSITGPIASSVTWTATKKKAWTTLTTASATGSGKVRWTRDPGPLSAATYVDTITIAASGGVNGAIIIDTLVVGAATTLTASVGGRRVAAVAGQAPIGDSANVTLTGPVASTATWTATKRQAWTTLTTAGGTGSGKVRWRRSPGALAPATYVDTITIAASDGVNGATIIDTLVVAAPTVLAIASLSPDSSGAVVGMDVAVTLSVDLTQVAKSLASYAATVTWDSTVIRLDSVKSVAGGFASALAVEADARPSDPAKVVSSALAAVTSTNINAGSVSLSATDPAGKTGSVVLARLYFHIVADAPAGGAQTSITPSFTSASSIASQETNLVPAIAPHAGKVVHVAGALRGDLNLDGKITTADVQGLMKSLVKASPTGIRALPNGDANCNGKLEAVDAQIILRKLAGLPVEQFCVGTIK